ncbi:F-box protein At3g47030-like [Capsella rubella]|uniref:F-box protein At3g47030-like n=1 Tax=Capsella rubella TaxID=81985 RepID=UPI000CD522D4|nr:F-box protein At3g47030-like [Capsella rubella]XP_023638751.1 F-box protein At3g47030-like [Capsella rubella]
MEAQENQVPKMNPLSISERSIPIDLLISVFSRLPVKSIGRCRCVSKQWSYILRRRDFTDLYLKTSSTRPCLLFNLKVNGKCLFLSAPQDQISSSVLVADRRMSFPTEDASCGVSRPVCGLVCSLDMNPSICNTSTGQCITLPKMKIASGGGTVNVYFGYEPVRKLFKVLRKSKDDYRVMTLGRGELSWRIVESSVAHSSLSNGICINGFMYYIAVRNDPRCLKPIMLVCFDMSLEKFTFLDVDIMLWRSTLIDVKDDMENEKWSKHVYKLPSSWKNLVGKHKEMNVVGMSGAGDIVFAPEYLDNDPFFIVYYNVVKNTVGKAEVQLGVVVRDADDLMKVQTFMDHVEDVKLMEVLGSS